MTDPRDPPKPQEPAGEPLVATPRHAVPAEAVGEPDDHRPATMDELRTHLAETRAAVQPVLDDLRDK